MDFGRDLESWNKKWELHSLPWEKWKWKDKIRIGNELIFLTLNKIKVSFFIFFFFLLLLLVVVVGQGKKVPYHLKKWYKNLLIFWKRHITPFSLINSFCINSEKGNIVHLKKKKNCLFWFKKTCLKDI